MNKEPEGPDNERDEMQRSDALAADQAVRAGDTTGLAFDARTLTVFEAAQGRALLSAANERVLDG